jgi:translation elongation factor EF-G
MDEIRRAIRRRRSRWKFIPILCGASFKNKGVQALLDAVIDYLPAPIDVPAIRGTCRTTTRRSSTRPSRTTRRSPRSRSRSRPTRSSES